jgi:hypothetical protein
MSKKYANLSKRQQTRVLDNLYLADLETSSNTGTTILSLFFCFIINIIYPSFIETGEISQEINNQPSTSRALNNDNLSFQDIIDGK